MDNILVSYDGWLGDAAKLYADSHDMKDPMLSPVYGNVSGFPHFSPLNSRSFFEQYRAHAPETFVKGVNADLIVFEGVSHAQYHMLADASGNQIPILQSWKILPAI